MHSTFRSANNYYGGTIMERWTEQDKTCADIQEQTMAGDHENGRLARIEEKIDMLLDRTKEIPTECVQHNERIGTLRTDLDTACKRVGGLSNRVWAVVVGTPALLLVILGVWEAVKKIPR
jgi:hypothetical protein